MTIDSTLPGFRSFAPSERLACLARKAGLSDDEQASSDSEEDPVERARNARDRLSRRFDLHKQRKGI